VFLFSAILSMAFGRIVQEASGGGQLVLAAYQTTFRPLLYGIAAAIILSLALKESGPSARAIEGKSPSKV
jgi:hypothetical protein